MDRQCQTGAASKRK